MGDPRTLISCNCMTVFFEVDVVDQASYQASFFCTVLGRNLKGSFGAQILGVREINGLKVAPIESTPSLLNRPTY